MSFTMHTHNLTSSDCRSGGLGKVVAGTIAATAIVGGASVAYAKYDKDFRSKLESNVPYSNSVLDLLIGEKSPQTEAQKSPVSSAKTSSKVEPSLLQKKLEREESSKPAVTSSNKSTPSKDVKSTMSFLPPAPPIPGHPKSSSSAKEEKKPEANLAPGNSPLVGGSTRTIAREEEMKEKAEKMNQPKAPLEEPSLSSSSQTNSSDDLREQLKLQLAAYSDYLKEQLQLQRQELGREHDVILEERLLQEKIRYQTELASSIARLSEIERVLAGKLSMKS